MLTMQEALLRLTGYWVERGCLMVQPFNTEVGAGTLNPATFLRVLGPEPWAVAYVEPSVRPDDSRYGDNPNRVQTHTQFQVILKPEPGDPQEQYLGSLAALGIDLAAHDVRFVEDNWESPALGAWGLGWEVWLDGLEITQFTYFQQAGGLALDPVSVEITYGMERILMALQGVDHFKEITYADGVSGPVTYGEVFGQAEYEMSVYYLDQADVDVVRTLFDSYESEARRLVDARLPVPAHGYVLKCSHAFNVLDSRGAIGTTERARAFARMRKLAHDVAALWYARREEEGFPLAVVVGDPADPTSPDTGGDERASNSTGTSLHRPRFRHRTGFHLGPRGVRTCSGGDRARDRGAASCRACLRDRTDRIRSRCGAHRCPDRSRGSIRVVGPPRRIVMVVEGVSASLTKKATLYKKMGECKLGPMPECPWRPANDDEGADL